MGSFLKKPRILLLLLIIIGVSSILLFRNGNGSPDYDFVLAERKTVAQEVTVTGRVKPFERVELAFEKTGTVSQLLVEVGEQVKKGEVLARLDSRKAEQQVRNAEVQLEEAIVALEQIELERAQSLRGDNLNESYEEGLAILTDMYADHRDILDDLDDILFGSDFNSGQDNIQYYAFEVNDFATPAKVLQLFTKTEVLYTTALAEFQMTQRGIGQARGEAIQKGYDLANQTAEIIKIGRDAIRAFKDVLLTGTGTHIYQTTIDNHTSTLSGHSTDMNAHVADLLAVVTAINNETDTVENYDLDIASQKLTIRKQEIALEDARDDLAKYSIVAPLDAVLAKRDIRIGETIAANTPVLTVITEMQYEIEVNVPEADIAKVKKGNIASITLDAYGRDEIFKAEVAKIDPAEIIIEGVPTYKVTLLFVEEDSRIRSGMTANLIITGTKKDNVIAVPQRAIVRAGDRRFVRIVQEGIIKEVDVETGLQGSDGTIEIVNGISPGDQVIVFFPTNNTP